MTILSEKVRQNLADSPGLGAGNFIFYIEDLFDYNPQKILVLTDKVVRTPDGKLVTQFTMPLIIRCCKLLASWYLQQNITSGDRVAVYIENSFDNFLHYLALTSIGAVPALINGNLAEDIVAEYCIQIAAVGIVTNTNHFIRLKQKLDHKNFKAKFSLSLVEEIDITQINLPQLYPYKHSKLDPIMICHTSGTTGFPKPVLLQHEKFFHGIDDFLRNSPEFLKNPPYESEYRLLSALPTVHNSSIAYFMRAILSQIELVIISDQSVPSLFENIKKHRPSIVVAFPHYFVGLSNLSVTKDDLRSVSYWISTGDASHQTHIKKLIKYGHHFEKHKFVAGSCYIDCLGSSEMGSSLFRMMHKENISVPPRCVGTPVSWVTPVIFDQFDKEIDEPYRVGKLGVKGLTVTSGYWNNEKLNTTFKKSEYILTGDMVYKDSEGRFYQVDRITDVIMTKRGPLYSVLTEEFILSYVDDIYDCILVGITDKLGSSLALGLLIGKQNKKSANTISLLDKINSKLKSHNLTTIDSIELLPLDDIPLGVTGKILKRALRERISNRNN